MLFYRFFHENSKNFFGNPVENFVPTIFHSLLLSILYALIFYIFSQNLVDDFPKFVVKSNFSLFLTYFKKY